MAETTTQMGGTQIGTPPPPPNPQPTPNPTPTATTWDNPDGSLNKAYYEKLPDDIAWMKDTLSKYGTREELIRGFANNVTLNNKKGLIPLPTNASKEALAERKVLLDGINGVPKEAKDYGITKPADFPDDYWKQSLVENFSKWAHEHSVSPDAAKKLITLQLANVQEEIRHQETFWQQHWANETKTFEEAVRTENIPGGLAKANELAERGAKALGFNLEDANDKRILDNSKVRLAFMRHALATGEDTFVSGDADAALTANDPMKLAEGAMHDKANPLYTPLYDPNHPQHQMAKAKVDEWLRLAHARDTARQPGRI